MEPHRTEALLADLPWLQGLARELARDPDLAADAVQDACVVALRHDGGIAHRRAWLATVLRNCLLLRHRGDRRTATRESKVARQEAGEGTAELVQRAELQQRLVAVVLGLPEHYRDVVLLRFFDNLPPRTIARRLSVPVATVHSRLQRALQQLRQQLDRRCGGRDAWAAVALSLPPVAAWPWLTLGVLMQTKLKISFALLVAAGTATWWWQSGDSADTTPALAAEPRSRRGGNSDGGGSGGAAMLPAAHQDRTVVDAPRRPPAPDEARITVRGRVCSCDGLAMPAVPVTAASSDDPALRAVSDAAGVFTLELPARPASLRVEDDRYVTVMGADWTPDTSVEPILVVAPALVVGGRVVDTRQAPVAGARVLVQLPEDFDARFPMPLDRGQRIGWSTRTDADGRFDLGRIPRLDGGSLMAVADALRPATQQLPPGDDRDLQIVLAPFAYEEGQLDGRVVDPQGLPVAGARVAMGVTSVVSDRDGRFALLLRRAGWPTAVVAAKPGYLPGRFELPRGGGAARDEWPDEVVLQLGQPPLSIHGRVVDQDGNPVEDAPVWVSDPTLLGIAGVAPLQVEYVLAGGELSPNAARMRVPYADDPTRDDMVLEQTTSRMFPSACWFFVRTGDDGAFEIPGLLPRTYRLRAFDPRSGVTVDTGPVPAGGQAELRVVRDDLWPKLRGRVVSLSGRPLGGVEVRCQVGVFDVRERVPGGYMRGSVSPEVATTRTDEDGTFALEQIDGRRGLIDLWSDGILPRRVLLAGVADPLHLVVEVEARCHVEVVLADPAEADEVAAETADGEPVDVSILRSGSHQALTGLELHDGRSGVFVLGERAARLVLRKGDVEVRTVPLQLDPGRTLRVQ